MDDIMQRYDPELLATLQKFPNAQIVNWNDLPQTRANTKAMLTSNASNNPTVLKEDRMVPGPEGAPEVPVRVYHPKTQTGLLPALFWIHGGGYVVGSIEQDDAKIQRIVGTVGCVAVSVGYRLAPEHHFPAPIDDCYAALKWLAGRTDELMIDHKRIAIGGTSAGGGLAAGLTLLARDRGEIPICYQVLISPMIDNLNNTPSSHAFANAHLWSRQDNQRGWNAYLGSEADPTNVSPYASASRASNVSNLPPSYITACSLEVFLDEDVEYALRLARTGTPVELHVYPSAFHGFDSLAPSTTISERFRTDLDQALKRGLHL